MIYIDTHVLVWLYAGRRDLLSEPAARGLEENQILVSPIVLLELEYLRETGRISVDPTEIYQELHVTIGLRSCDLPFGRIVESARSQKWTRDPFDRLIVGHAAAAGRPLLTKDESIRAHYDRAVW